MENAKGREAVGYSLVYDALLDIAEAMVGESIRTGNRGVPAIFRALLRHRNIPDEGMSVRLGLAGTEPAYEVTMPSQRACCVLVEVMKRVEQTTDLGVYDRHIDKRTVRFIAPENWREVEPFPLDKVVPDQNSQEDSDRVYSHFMG